MTLPITSFCSINNSNNTTIRKITYDGKQIGLSPREVWKGRDKVDHIDIPSTTAQFKCNGYEKEMASGEALRGTSPKQRSSTIKRILSSALSYSLPFHL